MKKLICITMMLVVVFVGSFGGFVTVQAEENSEVTQETFTVGMALPFTMLETYLYALAGEQAVETYYENEENQEALHKDFCDFMSDTSSGIKMNMKINGVMAMVTMGQLMEFYKTAGSSALAGANEETKNNLKVIMGGGNSDSDNDGDNGDDKNVKIASATSTALVTEIANYIDKLVKGERGEVSETFVNGGQEKPSMYFDGDYTIFENDLYFEYTGYWSIDSSYSGQFRGNSLLKMRVDNVVVDGRSRYALLLSPVHYYDTKPYAVFIDEPVQVLLYSPYFYYLNKDGSIVKSQLKTSTDVGNGLGYYINGYGHPFFDMASIAQFNAIPIFNSEKTLLNYINDGDVSGALNNFDVADRKEEWFDFDFSAITGKLDELLKAFKNLPLITTDSLAGFAQGVNNGVVAGQLPQADPSTQQQELEKLIEDVSKKVVTEQLADDYVNQTDESLAEEFQATPKPTYTPEQNVTKKQAKMMVDLHEFFPFCVPYDLVHLIKVLNAKPVAPCFETTIVYEPLNINAPIKLDMAQFEDVAKVFRITETALFILALILVSRSLIRG